MLRICQVLVNDNNQHFYLRYNVNRKKQTNLCCPSFQLMCFKNAALHILVSQSRALLFSFCDYGYFKRAGYILPLANFFHLSTGHVLCCGQNTLKTFDRTQDIFPLFFCSLTFYIYKSFPEAKKGRFILILYSHVHFKG